LHFRSINSRPQFRHIVLTDFIKLRGLTLGCPRMM